MRLTFTTRAKYSSMARFVFAVLELAGSSEYPTSHSIKQNVLTRYGVAVIRTTFKMATLISSLIGIVCQLRETGRPN